jgi:hypothetical protein
MKRLKIHNPHGLPTIPYTELEDFQGDLKHPIEPELLDRLKRSLVKHGVFVPKFVWFDKKRRALILDGHQTRKALGSLEDDGWVIPGIPYVRVKAKNRKDAGEKLLQINSRYARFNTETTWFEDLDLDIEEMLASISIPELEASFGPLSDIEFREYDETIADNIEICCCPTCGNEHARKKQVSASSE